MHAMHKIVLIWDFSYTILLEQKAAQGGTAFLMGGNARSTIVSMSEWHWIAKIAECSEGVKWEN